MGGRPLREGAREEGSIRRKGAQGGSTRSGEGRGRWEEEGERGRESKRKGGGRMEAMTLSVPEPLLDTQGLILSPDIIFRLLSQTQLSQLALPQGCHLSTNFTEPLHLLHLSVFSTLCVLVVPEHLS